MHRNVACSGRCSGMLSGNTWGAVWTGGEENRKRERTEIGHLVLLSGDGVGKEEVVNFCWTPSLSSTLDTLPSLCHLLLPCLCFNFIFKFFIYLFILLEYS